MIKASAVKRKSDGKIWTGKRHGDCFRQIVSELGIATVTRKEFIQGFVTNEDEFVDRKKAYKIAVDSNQLLQPDDPWASPTLMSEDLW